jgi:pimeloyl-ACP methyl ester carboxylesterase
MTTATPAPLTSRTVSLPDGVTLDVTDHRRPGAGAGADRTVLLLHGGAGPQSVAGLAATLSADFSVIVPTHPGFDGQPRPSWLDSAADLALAYLDLLAATDLRDVVVIGNSFGGWIAAEMALRGPDRVGALVLLNAVGIEGEIVDTFALPPAELSALAFHRPESRPDPAKLAFEQLTGRIANQATLAVYAPTMSDPKLRRRLRHVQAPVLVAWGEHDGIVGPAYGRDFAAAFPNARFELVTGAAHFPHIEEPRQTSGLVREFILAPPTR